MHTIVSHLNNRDVRGDGVIQVTPDQLEEMIIRGIPISQLRTSELTSEIKRFNAISDEKIEMLDDSNYHLNLDWNIPDEFKNLDLDQFVADIIKTESSEIAEIRLLNELQEFKRRDLQMFLRTVIFIVSEFKKHNVVWGVGRGSSCASYLLYKIGLHSVNPIKYNIQYSEFFHD